MKKYILFPLLLATSISLSHAAIIINDFENLDIGTPTAPGGHYDGKVGEAFTIDDTATPAIRGNVTGSTSYLRVLATGGVGNSKVLEHITDTAIRSRATAPISALTSFSTYFKFESVGTTNEGFIMAGWATTNGTENTQFYQQGDDRLGIGLRRTNAGTGHDVQVIGFGRMNATTDLTGTGGDVTATTLTVGNWYQMSFDLAVDTGSTSFTLDNFAVRDWGTDGLTGGSTILSLETQTVVSPTFGSNVIAAENAYALIRGHGNVGVDYIDNVSVVPEPSTYALIGGILSFALVYYRRRKN